MAKSTSIEWCDATFNPWWGCQQVSPACDHCYAKRDAARFAPGRALWGVGAERRTFGERHWSEPLKWAREMPARLGRRPRVFSASMADWLDLDAPLDEFVRLLDTIRRTPELDWLLLSKRIGVWRKRLGEALNASNSVALREWIALWLSCNPPSNVCAWGAHARSLQAQRQVETVRRIVTRVRGLTPLHVFALRKLADGTPAHPLMLAYSTELVRWG